MSFWRLAFWILPIFVGTNALAGEWKVCFNSVDGGDRVKSYARTLDECQIAGRRLGREACRELGVESVIVDGQFRVNNPVYFQFEVKCFIKPDRDPILQ